MKIMTVMMAQNSSTKNYNGIYLLRQSFYWFCFAFLFLFEVKILNGIILRLITNKLVPDFLILPIEYSIFAISAINAFYCLLSYMTSLYRNFAEQLSIAESKTATRQNNKLLDESLRTGCVKSLYAFISDFFKLSGQAPAQRDLNLTLSSTTSEQELRNTSLSSLVGYHDSPLNRSVTSVHTRSQLKELLDNETCDSVADPSDCTAFFTRDFGDSFTYRMGTAQHVQMKTSTAMEGIQSLLFESRTEYEQQQRRPERRLYHRAFSTTADATPRIHVETNIREILKFYGLDEADLEAFELKLRIWICNTILRPLLDKIDELNGALAEKHPNLHVRIGQSSLDTLQAHKVDLCNSWLPFILPYIRVHPNQPYILNRVHTLAQNIALEEFKWSGGQDLLVRDENNAFTRLSAWNDQLPTDTELIWHFFCTYMDFHLSPSSDAVAAINESSKPFSNVYFVKSSTSTASADDVPLSFKARREEQKLREGKQQQPQMVADNSSCFFIRMTSTNPPCFELIVDGGDTIMVPLKDTQHNFWLTLILFLAHVQKTAHQRIGHVNMESLSLNIFDI